MFRSEGSASNGDPHSMNDISFSESSVPHVCLACGTSLCCSFIWYVTDVSCCIALFTLVQVGLGRYQTGRCVSVMLLPLVRLPLVFRLLVSTCSITRYADNMHSLGELPVNIGIRVLQPSHLLYSPAARGVTLQKYPQTRLLLILVEEVV